MSLIHVNGINLYYEVHGEGKPLVLIEGLGYSSWMWFKQVPELQKYLKVVVFDNRGVGNSDKPDEDYTIRLFADDTAVLIKELGFEKADVMGVSMGGFVAQELAIEYPELVDRLILASTSFGGPDSVPMPQDTLDMMKNGTKGDTPEASIKLAMATALTRDYMEKRQDELDRIVKWRMENPQPRYAYMRQFMAGANFNEEERVSNIKAPTLIMAGRDDMVVPHENAFLLNGKIKNSTVKLFDGGHLFFIESSEDVNREIINFLT